MQYLPRGPEETTDMGSKEPCLSHRKSFCKLASKKCFSKNRHACRAVIPAEWSTTYGQLHHYYCCYITGTMILCFRGEGRGAKSKLMRQLRGIRTHDTSPNHHCQKTQTSGVTDTKEFNYSSYPSCVWNKWQEFMAVKQNARRKVAFYPRLANNSTHSVFLIISRL